MPTMKTLLLAAAPLLAAADKYAVLVAGSNSYSNYRHQADIAHAYNILTEGGVPKENIITMMYDDIASHITNKFRGKLFNQPDAADGTPPKDVYAAVKDNIDYRRRDVTPDNFVKVLTGDSANGGGRVLTSGPEDDVFIYFADHGGVGLLAFPGGLFSATLHADKLNAALKTMASKRMFKRLVFYVEACESGSMFDGLLDPSLGIYAVTAANAKESSWGWYCDSSDGGDKVHGKAMGVCLGDEFSVRWMEDTDKGDEATETLGAQYKTVKAAVTKSHVMTYGNTSFVSSPLATFLGVETPAHRSPHAPTFSSRSSVSSRDTELHYLRWRLASLQAADADTSVEEVAEAERELAAEEAQRAAATTLFSRVWHRVSGLSTTAFEEMSLPPRHFECHRAVQRDAKLQYTDFSLQYHRVVVNLCELGFEAANITRAFDAAVA